MRLCWSATPPREARGTRGDGPAGDTPAVAMLSLTEAMRAVLVAVGARYDAGDTPMPSVALPSVPMHASALLRLVADELDDTAVVREEHVPVDTAEDDSERARETALADRAADDAEPAHSAAAAAAVDMAATSESAVGGGDEDDDDEQLNALLGVVEQPSEADMEAARALLLSRVADPDVAAFLDAARGAITRKGVHVFVSYAWPKTPAEAELHGFLTQLRADLLRAGAEVTMDLYTLTPAMSIADFMRDGVRDASHVLLVGTPTYRERVAAGEGSVATEFAHIAEKRAADAGAVVPVLYSGRFATALPDHFADTFSLDMRDRADYVLHLAKLVGALCGGDEGVTAAATALEARVAELRAGDALSDARVAAFVGAETAVQRQKQRERMCEIADRVDALSQMASEYRVVPDVWGVPDPAPTFVGRTGALAAIGDALQLSGSELRRVAVVAGIGGSGKSEVARHWAQQHMSRFSLAFWLNGESWLTLSQSYRTLAQALGIVVEGRDDEEVVGDVLRHLQRPSVHKGWLLVYDNVDEPSLLTEARLPRRGGSVLITSRSQQWPRFETVVLGELQRDDSVSLLCALTGEHGEGAEKHARDIAEQLGDFPLAVAQAGHTIANNELVDLAAYACHLSTHASELLSRASATSAYPHSLTAAWELSTMHLGKENARTLDALAVCAFLAPDNIPARVLSRAVASEGKKVSEFSEADETGRALSMLCTFSLLTKQQSDDAGGTVYAVHRLFQTITCDGLSEADQRKWVERAIKAVSKEFQFSKYRVETWKGAFAMLSHVLAVCEHAKRVGVMLKKAAGLLTAAGKAFQVLGDYHTMVDVYRRALTLLQSIYDEDSIKLEHVYRSLGHGMKILGDGEGALVYLHRCLAINRKHHEGAHPHTAYALQELSDAFRVTGDFAEARRVGVEVLEMKKKLANNAVNKDRVAWALCSLGRVEAAAGNFDEALRLQQEATKLREDMLKEMKGRRDPRMLGFQYSSLGEAHRLAGNVAEAITWGTRGLEMKLECYSDSHVSTCASHHFLGRALHDDGQYDEARGHLYKALQHRRAAFGPAHYRVGESLFACAQLEHSCGNDERSLALCKRAAATLNESNGKKEADALLAELGAEKTE